MKSSFLIAITFLFVPGYKQMDAINFIYMRENKSIFLVAVGLSTANTATTANQNGSTPAPTPAPTTTTSSSSFQCRAIVETTTTKITASEAVSRHLQQQQQQQEQPQEDQLQEDSSESETDNNDETGTTDKFLLLVDQLSLEQPHHLSIKDIGIILDRLNSKIIDIGMLERQIEASDTHNWTIKATIRGDVMRELGVIYNSNYYAISEHPSFSFKALITTSGLGEAGQDDLDDDMDDFEEIDHAEAGPSIQLTSLERQ
jgi:hypothetical protein